MEGVGRGVVRVEGRRLMSGSRKCSRDKDKEEDDKKKGSEDVSGKCKRVVRRDE